MSTVLVEEKETLLTISLNRPKMHNALDGEMIQHLKEIFESVAARKHIRVVHLKGVGPSFCTGADLKYMRAMAEDNLYDNMVDAQKIFDMFKAGSEIPVPMIGEVHGKIFGGGIGLTAICDIAFAHENTQFCFSETKLGIVPAVISPFIAKRISFGIAKNLMFTAKIFDAKYAEKIGLIYQVDTTEKISQSISETIESIVNNGPKAIRMIKSLLSFVESKNYDEITLREKACRALAESRMSQEGQEGLRCFFKKEIPEWQRRKT